MLDGGAVIPLADQASWDTEIESWPASDTDVYFTAGYHHAFAPVGSEPFLFRFEREAERLVYPLLLRPIDRVGDESVGGSYHDIETVYGFCGPISTTAHPSFLRAAWDSFDAWCRERSVVAEFVRLNPILANERYCPPAMTTAVVRDHVVLGLGLSEEEIWQTYSSINRNMIRKAQKRGVDVQVLALSDCLGRFVELYQHTMDRNVAASSYYFSEDVFRRLAATTPCFACAASVDGVVEAVSLFLEAGDRVHYHLSGGSPAGRKLAANNLVLHTAVQESKRRGFGLFHFGGGRTGALDDPLLRFKAGFSPERRPAKIGRRVHDAVVYDKLCALRRRQTASVPAGYFLAYRFEPGGQSHA